MTTTPEINWTNIGRLHTQDCKQAIINAIESVDRGDRAHAGFDEWLAVPTEGEGLSLPFTQGEAIKSAIKELCLPRVSHVCMVHHSPGVPWPYGIYGIRAHYGPKQRQHQVEVFVMDDGCSLTALLTRVWPKPE